MHIGVETNIVIVLGMNGPLVYGNASFSNISPIDNAVI